MDTKICGKCKVEKPINEFYFRKDTKDRLSYKCIECFRNYYKENEDKFKKYSKTYQEENTDRVKKWKNDWYNNNKEELRIRHKKYYHNYYKEAGRERKNKYNRERRKAGLVCKLHKNISLGIWRSLRNGKNGHSWEELAGYTLEDLRKHLESQFKDGMTWQNYGKNGWEIDHKIPISLFNITGIRSKGFKKCWALENLQPMWADENRKKHKILFY